MLQRKQIPSYILSILAIGLTGGLYFGCAKQDTNSPVTAQTPPPPSYQEIVQPAEVRPLPGQLDTVPMFNSNSPEWVKTPGILLSTFPGNGKKVPSAHLNFPFQGRFDVFVHHQTHTPKDLQTFYLGVILHNPTSTPVTVNVLQAASYLTQDAPYIKLPTYVENPNNTVYAGPGDRAGTDVLQGKRQANFPDKIVIPPNSSRMLMNLPTPVRNLEKPINGRSAIIRLQSSGKVYAASLTMFAPKDAAGKDRAPTLEEWQNLLDTSGLAMPRDKAPSPPEQKGGQLIYGRVAGVASGSLWKAQITDSAGSKDLTLPQPEKPISYPISTLRGGQLGTGQNQTAKMLVRYPDTAYEAHGNYAVEYNLTLPLYNPTNQQKTVTLTLETPLKEDRLSKAGLRFRKPSQDFPFFRGTVRLSYKDEAGKPVTRYVHLWHKTGQVLEPLLTLTMPANSRNNLRVDLIYPPDSTPPQVLTLKTLK
ncbi:DUF3370 domain-containing protein [Microcoleus sp. FACHB-68]|uniref:DUF3370 domain-containing protein n=1 Tax=Microcoleus sp. FACHB-68 TaxID=2692826 RepID=UPI0016831BC0|nr:DUF3370 domain-containing protein [Microcoleus sp. FACHB-68]MBD1937263.1 DUF3370 domain-containing protein [Microcoleus sp. FACHB-68]